MIIFFQVLYDQLDVYLNENEEDKKIVYNPLDSNITPDETSNYASSSNLSCTNTKQQKNSNTNNVIDHFNRICNKCKVSVNECECDLLQQNDDIPNENATSAKKKRNRKRKNKDARTQDSRDNSDMTFQMRDQLLLLPSAQRIFNRTTNTQRAQEESTGWGDLPESNVSWTEYSQQSLNPNCVVSVEDLSECEMSDRESDDSEILDFDRIQEDRLFMRAQRTGSRDNSDRVAFSSQIASISNLEEASSFRTPNSDSNSDQNLRDVNRGCDANIGNLVDDNACSNIVNSFENNDINNSVKFVNTDNVKINSENVKSYKNNQTDICSSKKGRRGKVCDQILNSLANMNVKTDEEESKKLLKDNNLKSRKINNHQAQINNSQFQKRNDMSVKKKNMNVANVDEVRTVPSVSQVQRLPNWTKFVQRTGSVVHILEKKHNRLGAGALKVFADKNANFALFSPTDNRVPRMKIPMKQCPPDFLQRSQDYANRIFLARIVQWKEPKFALGYV